MQAFLLYVDDWLSSKQIEMMDAIEERGYLRLLMRAAKELDGGLPDDNTQLAIMSMVGVAQWNKPTADKSRRVGSITSGEKLRKCFVLRDGRLYNLRLLREFEYQAKVREKRALAGSKGGHKKQQNSIKALASAVANEQQKGTNHSLGLCSSYKENIPLVANSGNAPLPPLISQTEYPLVIAAIRKHDAAVDNMFVLRLVQTCVQYCLSSQQFPQDQIGHVNDRNIARCCEESYKTGPPNHGSGLLLKRVPPILVTWALEP